MTALDPQRPVAAATKLTVETKTADISFCRSKVRTSVRANYYVLNGGRGTALHDEASSPRAVPLLTNCSYTLPRQSLHSVCPRPLSTISARFSKPRATCCVNHIGEPPSVSPDTKSVGTDVCTGAR